MSTLWTFLTLTTTPKGWKHLAFYGYKLANLFEMSTFGFRTGYSFLKLLTFVFIFGNTQQAFSGDCHNSTDYQKITDLTLQVIGVPEARKFVASFFPDQASQKFTQGQAFYLIQCNPQIWRELNRFLLKLKTANKDPVKVSEVYKDFRPKFTELFQSPLFHEKLYPHDDLAEPLELPWENQRKPPIRKIKYYANHIKIDSNGKTKKADDLLKTWIDFFKGAKKQVMLNVFDFDLMELAEVIVDRAKDGLEIHIGIDKNNVAEHAGVKKVFDFLMEASKTHKGLHVIAVDSVGLNHQKIGVRDWEIKNQGAVFFSSGNLTYSCTHPWGDPGAYGFHDKNTSPNANNAVLMESDIMAMLGHMELSKTLLPEYLFRGADYPPSGSYRLGKSRSTYAVVAFSPNGGDKGVNRDIIAREIEASNGTIRLLQFSFSSAEVEAALLKKAQETETFNFGGIGDTLSSSQDWNVFRHILGFDKDGKDPESPWSKLPSPTQMAIRSNTWLPPEAYNLHQVVLPSGEKINVSTIMHHKVLVTDKTAVLGTSFNFSEGAERNQEQTLAIHDPEAVEFGNSIFDGLRSMVERLLFDALSKPREVLSGEEISCDQFFL